MTPPSVLLHRGPGAALVAALILLGCGSGTRAPEPLAGADGAPSPDRPRYSPDATRVAFHAGAEGARRIFVVSADGTGLRAVTRGDGDHRDPTWGPDGRRLVYASNQEGAGYDLYVIDVDAADAMPARVTDLSGDAVHPAVSSLRYGLYAVGADGCSADGATATQADGYEKVVFTRVYDGLEEIWFASLAPVDPKSVVRGWHRLEETSAHGTHTGRLSAPGQRCRHPAFSLDGLSLAWTCDERGPVVHDTRAHWDHTFAAALAAIDTGPDALISACAEEDFDPDRCYARLPRRYTRYEGQAVSAAGDGVERPSYSANQILLVGDAAGRAVYRPRFVADAAWTALPVEAAGVRDVTWRPDGAGVAYATDTGGRPAIGFAATDLYLQRVRNLHEFPELHGDGASELLSRNRFVARAGSERELYALYEKLRYRKRPQFVTADAALQAFRDELQTILQRAEMRAAKDLRALSRALMDHYARRYAQSRSESDRYYAVYFATAWVPLEAAATLELPTLDDHYEQHFGGGGDDDRSRELARPVLERLPAQMRTTLAAVPAPLRGQVSRHLETMLAHAGVGALPVPSRPKPARVDWSQFRVRGSYADGPLAGYFLAVSWYAQAPLPFDGSLVELSAALEQVRVGDASAYAVWQRVDAVVSSFMGKPVDATLAHLAQVRSEMPRLLAPFDAEGLEARLLELRGPMPLRDAEAAETGEGARKIQLTLLPKRMGLDSTFFVRLTHPEVPERGFPTSLEVMAVLGSRRARHHALAAAGAETYAGAYQQALDELIGTQPTPTRDPGYFATDVYHSWLAALVALARQRDVPAESLLAFARTEAWHDRRLYSALAGYTQLKHSAVLYNMQDMGIECGSETTYYVAVEQPLLPTPRGFVEPDPEFFDALAALADMTYRRLHGDAEGPEAHFYVPYDVGDDDKPRLNARTLARDLAAIARDQLAGKQLTEGQLRHIEYIGARLEAITLGMNPDTHSFAIGGERRGERGIALVTDIHTNLVRQQVLQLGVGRIADLYVAVPDGVGEQMTQGGIFTFYEFLHPMSDRLTDEQWAERVERGELPPRPAWTASFFEDAR